MSPTTLLFLTAGGYTAMLIGLAVWAARCRARKPRLDETTALPERCPRCRGRLGVVEIFTGRGQLLCCAEGHRWQVELRADGSRVLRSAPEVAKDDRWRRRRLRLVR